MSMMPTLSQVRDADWSHLMAAATHWHTAADTWNDVWDSAVAAVSTAPWTGVGRDAALAAHTADAAAAHGQAAAWRAAAGRASAGHGNLMAMRSALLEQVDQATRAGYQVSEAFTVTPPLNMPPWIATALATDMATRTADLQSRAVNLVAYDTEVGAQVATPATLVDFRTDGPSIAPWDTPDPTPTAAGPLSAGVIPEDDKSLIAAVVGGCVVGGTLEGVMTEGAGAFDGCMKGGLTGGLGYFFTHGGK